jgi:predicted transcriptional regulator
VLDTLVLIMKQPRTVQDLIDVTGRAQDVLYRHMRVLHNNGLVYFVEHETARRNQRTWHAQPKPFLMGDETL